MSDLIERLRDESSRQNDWANDGESTVVGNGPELLLEAADEIERLETHKDHCFDRMRTMQAEIERLKAVKESG